MTPENV